MPTDGRFLQVDMEFESNDTDLDFEPSDYSDIFLYTDILMVALSLIGIAGNILIISTILSSKSLQTRTYLLLMNWSIFNILYRIFAESLLYLLPINLNLKAEMICLTINLNSIFQLAEIVFLLALISNWAVKSTRMNNLLVIFIFYALIVLVLIVMMGLCMFNVFTRIVETSAGIAYLCLLITVIAKTVNRVYKARVDPLSEDTARRLNLASIYTLWFFCLIAIIIPLGFYKQFIYMDYVVKSTNLIPFAFIAYLIRVDHVFKSTFIDIMKCRRPQQRPTENIAYDVHNNEGIVYCNSVK